MAKTRDRNGGIGAPAPPGSAEEALGRAREHARSAVAELLQALHALLDAATLATGGAPAAEHPVLAQLAQMLAGLAADLSPGGSASPDSVLAAVAQALDVEIARWEKRARQDPDARSVLRAFLGLRELLWEFGVRPGGSGPAPAHPPEKPPRAGRRASPPRVQRVRVEG